MHASPRQLRRALASDLPTLAAMEAQEHARWDHAAFVHEMHTAWSEVWVLEASAQPGERPFLLGFMVVWRVADEAQLLNIAVAQGQRRRGHAAFMLLALEEQARRAGLSRIVLEVRRSNEAAQQLYRQRGFTGVGVRPNYYPDTGEDAILMEQQISWNK